MQQHTPPQRPAAYAEQTLIHSLLSGEFPPGSALPAEREMAARLGITRPTLREVLQRLERDGWISIHHGKTTRVNDYWRDGGLNVLSAIVHSSQPLPENFIPNLLAVRLVMAPAYTRLAVEKSPAAVLACLQEMPAPEHDPATYAAFDWRLHHTLTIASLNPIFTLILNGFSGFYEQMACLYFGAPQAREASHAFYTALQRSTHQGHPQAAEDLTRAVMQESLRLWQESNRIYP